MLALNGKAVGLPASAVPAPSRCVSVGTECSYFFYFPERETLVYLQSDTEHTFGSCCGEANEFLAELSSERLKGRSPRAPRFSSLKDMFSALQSEIFFSKVPRAKYHSSAIYGLFFQSLFRFVRGHFCMLRLYVRSAFFFGKK